MVVMKVEVRVAVEGIESSSCGCSGKGCGLWVVVGEGAARPSWEGRR